MHHAHSNWMDWHASTRGPRNLRLSDFARRAYAAFFFSGLDEPRSRSTYHHRLFSAGNIARLDSALHPAPLAASRHNLWYGTQSARLSHSPLRPQPLHRDPRSR
jgi:hypothetical protein